ncbi:invasion associated locus B family protein [Nitratireductor sp. ZSWI3]|uniref:invasion associated locus B family protein n=1 Tax=Nitratireductor sp. ZSWI3 TaxID=2966359 RepID=UPI002150225D|nr:invasion associated locus B family protein [Nitratireductor sp. ZSWI3]MCR4264881.1 invasion associated locus B family protein [Nitratireductor sp. ZSWI3]
MSVAVAAIFFAATAALAQAETQSSDAPSSLSETYDDWTVACVGQGEKRRCAFTQRQIQKDGQRVLAIELTPSDDGGLRGSLVLPFGLDLKKGATFSIDDLPPGKPSHFQTCLPVGCILPLIFTEETTKALRASERLKIGTYASDAQKEVPFSVSLKGFAAALDRTIVLTQ